MLTQGSAGLEHLVDICVNELKFNPRLHLVDTADIHKIVRAEVFFSRSPLHQHLAQIFAGHPAALLLAQGLLTQSQQRPDPGGNVRRQPQSLAFQRIIDIDDEFSGPLEPELKKPQEQQVPSVPSEMHDATANQELAEPRSPIGKLSAPKAPTLIVTPRPPAKPLLPGGPCENPFCGVVEAPQWRRIDKKLVCNRCGMYWHRHAQFPDASYFSGLASKQAVRHIVVMHRSCQGTSPSGSSPPPPQPQELDKPAAGKQPRTQSPIQPQLPHREIAATTSARSHETDSHGSTNTSITNNNMLHVTNTGAGGISGATNTDNVKEKVRDVTRCSNDAACEGRMVGPPLDKEVLLKVLTGQCDHMDVATIRRAHLLLEQLQQLSLCNLGSSAVASQPVPEGGRVSSTAPSALAPVVSQEGQSMSTRKDPADDARDRLRLQGQSPLLPPPRQQQQQRAIGKQLERTSEIKLATLLQGRSLTSREALGSPQPKASSRDGNSGQQQPNPLSQKQAVKLASATGGSCNASHQEVSGSLFHVQDRRAGSGAAPASPPLFEGEGGQGRVSHVAPLGSEDCFEQRPQKRARTAGQIRVPLLRPQVTNAAPAPDEQCLQLAPSLREQSSQELLAPMLAAMLQHSKAMQEQEQQQKQKQRQQKQPRAPQLQQQQRTEAFYTATGGPRSGRSLLETIARVAQQQMLQQHWSKAPNQQRQQHPDYYQKRRRTSEEADANCMDDELMDASYSAAGIYGVLSANGGGILMRDLQNRAFLIQQQHRQRPDAVAGQSRAAAAVSSGQRGSAAADPRGPQSSSAAGAGIPSTRPYDSYDVDRSHVQSLPYEVTGSIAATRAVPPPAQIIYGPIAAAGPAGHGGSSRPAGPGLGSAYEVSYDVNSLLFDMFLFHGGAGKGAALQQLQANGLPVEAIASNYRPTSVVGGVRQASGVSAGLVLMPVLDLGKPPPALAF